MSEENEVKGEFDAEVTPEDTVVEVSEESKKDDKEPKEETDEEKSEKELKEREEKVKEYHGPIGKFRVTGEIYATDEYGNFLEEPLEIGSIQEVPMKLGKDWEKNGIAEEVVDIEEMPVVDTLEPEVIDPFNLSYEGKKIVGSIVTTSPGYKSFAVESGETFKITDAEFDQKVKN